jgi:hypothetical protein
MRGIGFKPISGIGNDLFDPKLAPPLQRAFPHPQNSPACFAKLSLRSRIAYFVAVDFLTPKGFAALRPSEKGAVMPVPETAMYKDDRFVTRQDHIGFARQAAVMKTVTETKRM